MDTKIIDGICKIIVLKMLISIFFVATPERAKGTTNIDELRISDTITAVSTYGLVAVFKKSENGTLNLRFFQDSHWHDWYSLNGSWTAAPFAIKDGSYIGGQRMPWDQMQRISQIQMIVTVVTIDPMTISHMGLSIIKALITG